MSLKADNKTSESLGERVVDGFLKGAEGIYRVVEGLMLPKGPLSKEVLKVRNSVFLLLAFIMACQTPRLLNKDELENVKRLSSDEVRQLFSNESRINMSNAAIVEGLIAQETDTSSYVFDEAEESQESTGGEDESGGTEKRESDQVADAETTAEKEDSARAETEEAEKQADSGSEQQDETDGQADYAAEEVVRRGVNIVSQDGKDTPAPAEEPKNGAGDGQGDAMAQLDTTGETHNQIADSGHEDAVNQSVSKGVSDVLGLDGQEDKQSGGTQTIPMAGGSGDDRSSEDGITQEDLDARIRNSGFRAFGRTIDGICLTGQDDDLDCVCDKEESLLENFGIDERNDLNVQHVRLLQEKWKEKGLNDEQIVSATNSLMICSPKDVQAEIENLLRFQKILGKFTGRLNSYINEHYKGEGMRLVEDSVEITYHEGNKISISFHIEVSTENSITRYYLLENGEDVTANFKEYNQDKLMIQTSPEIKIMRLSSTGDDYDEAIENAFSAYEKNIKAKSKKK